MVDLKKQYQKIKPDVQKEVLEVFESMACINGPKVKQFQEHLQQYLNVKHVIPCANGTDALQVALMALGLKQGDEVIVPSFTYVATAEVIGLLGLKPIMVDVDPDSFNITASIIEAAITPNTKAIVPVHLFGQSCDMEDIMKVASKYELYVVEDNAQAIGTDYFYKDGTSKKTGTIGHIGCTSFYPSKNLGCYGDGGAMMTNDDDLAQKLRTVANHGQSKRYYHDKIGVNSRLDAVQAAVLNIKLSHLDEYNTTRKKAADFYDTVLQGQPSIKIPTRIENSTHVFHQYTLCIKDGKREELQEYLRTKGIPSMIYYPVPLYKQKAFKKYIPDNFELPITEKLCKEVISLPMHSELDEEQLDYICSAVLAFFNN